jgi:hypothetical protein
VDPEGATLTQLPVLSKVKKKKLISKPVILNWSVAEILSSLQEFRLEKSLRIPDQSTILLRINYKLNNNYPTMS